MSIQCLTGPKVIQIDHYMLLVTAFSMYIEGNKIGHHFNIDIEFAKRKDALIGESVL